MDFYTKLFALNCVLIYVVAFIDTHVYNDYLTESEGFWGMAYGWWCLLTLISVPVWGLYKILTW